MVEFRGYDKPEGEVVKVMVHYSKGYGPRKPRGIYLDFWGCTRTIDQWGSSERFNLNLGGPDGSWDSKRQSYLIEELKRGNPKKLAEIAAELDPELESAALFFRQDLEATVDLIVAPHLRARLADPVKIAPPARLEMRPIPQAVLAKLPPLYANEEKGLEALVQAKFFTPDGAATWYATEFDGKDQFFGYVDLGIGPHCAELGYFSLSELKTVRGRMGLPVELDIHWSPKPLSAVMS